MKREEIKERVYKVLETKLPEETSLRDYGFDSLDFIELLMELEEEFGIKVDESKHDLGEIKTIGDVINFIAEYGKSKYEK